MYTKWNVALVFCGLNPVGPNGLYLTTPHKAVAGTTEGAPGNKKNAHYLNRLLKKIVDLEQFSL